RVESADILAAKIGVAGNDPGTSRYRREKPLMGKALEAAGLGHPRTYEARTLKDARDAAAELGTGTVVVKPRASTGSDGVRFCKSAGELEQAWAAIFGKTDRMGEPGEVVLVQEPLEGVHLTVNTVSVVTRDGETFCYVCEVWRDTRIVADGRPLYCHT